MGNAGVLAAYLIFGLFFSAYLALTEKKINWRWIFGASAAVHLIAVILTGTRGAYLGVAAGFLFAGAIIVYNLKSNKKIIKSAAIAAIALVLIYGGLFLSRDQDWVKSNLYLNRLTAFSLSDVTVKTRIMSWRWGLAGFRDKPIIGYGLEQFAIPYNKYFQAEYYNYAAGDTYFDRAHNIVVELLATTGIVGLASYFLLLATVFYCLIKIYKNKNDYVFSAVFGGLIIAYFIQNLLIFDLLPALLGFMVLLAVVNNNYSNGIGNEIIEKAGIKKELLAPIVLILLFCLVYSFNNFILKPYKALKDDVAGQVYLPYEYDKGMEFLKSSAGYNTPLDLDLRSAAANTIFNYYRDNQVDSRNIKDDIDFAISLYKENLKYLPDDLYYNYKIAEIMDYRFAIDLDKNIIQESKQYIDKAVSLSPGRAELYYIQAENLLMAGKLEEAVAADEKAVSLNDKLGQSYWELAKVCYEAAKYDKAKESLIKAIDLGYRIQEETLVGLRGLFNLEQSIDNEIEFLELIVKNGTNNYLFYSTLANKYYEIGNKEKAIEYAGKSAEINPEVKDKVEKFIERVNSK
jgi:tetratricopeptide (TPR) repeat protein